MKFINARVVSLNFIALIFVFSTHGSAAEFNSEFTKKEAALTDVKDEWSLKHWQSTDSEEQSIFRKNLSPRVQPGDRKYPYLVFLTFHYTPIDASGLPNPKDEDIFYQFEESGLNRLEEDDLSIFVGAVLKSGIRDHIFYTSDPEKFLNISRAIKSKYSKFNPDTEVLADPNWSQYHDFP